jgi:hypothetical protein
VTIDCLDAETRAAYLDGVLAADAVCRADRHIDRCPSCRRELSALAAVTTCPAATIEQLAVGRLGRFEVLRELGRGSNGIVMRAYDPELDRAVAVKIVTGEARERARREAQAMARLSHPNVATIFDVASHGDSLFIAMELVEGVTLRDRAGAPWRETLEICRLAGRGLAAAHAAQLVHRDYKPDNVLLGEDGRVVVADFGLAQLAGDHPAGIAGTPAYMAPELFRREPATAASDQYSFCVATYEVLYGLRPFAADTLAELRERIAVGVPREPATTRVPTWVRAVLMRGLSADPAKRFPSMIALLDALESPPRGRWIAGGALGAVLAVMLAARAVTLEPSADPVGAIALAGEDARVRAEKLLGKLEASEATLGERARADALVASIWLELVELRRELARWIATH